jgi:hypothetical protein
MGKSIDLKSLVIGGLLTLLVLSCFGAVPKLGQEFFGRFAIGATERGAFILDTATGQAWACIVHTDSISTDMIPSKEEFFSAKRDFGAPAR